MIITIDGPAGAGKSSVARALAQRLQVEFLDTGAMYRAIALAALRAGLNPRDPEAMRPLMARVRLQVQARQVWLEGEDVTGLIRTPEVTEASSAVATNVVVRQGLAALQRSIAENRQIVTEGRDQGTYVFPQATVKFFLLADLHERARRRQRELAEKGQVIELAELVRAMEARDQQDASRPVAPLKRAEDAVVLDSTGLTLEQVVDRMELEVRRRRTRE
jgi:cytidylate kinase